MSETGKRRGYGEVNEETELMAGTGLPSPACRQIFQLQRPRKIATRSLAVITIDLSVFLSEESLFALGLQ
jgi:hypothetical protein